MQELLKIEWLKIKNYRTFWILSSLFVLSVFGINYIVYYVQEVLGKSNKQIDVLIGSPFQYPNVWHTVSYISGFLLFFPGLLIIISVTNEFSFKTHRQNIIDGWSRSQFINVKILCVLILAFLSTVVVGLTALLYGSLRGGSFSFDKIQYIGYFFIQCFSYGMVALLLSVLIRRSGLAIGVFFLYSYVIENMLGGLMNYLNFRFTGTQTFRGPADYLPLHSPNALTPFPFFRSITKMISSEPNVPLLLSLSFVYLVIYYAFSTRKFLKADL
jgi:ABC-2 type transport system permease protein